MNHHNEINHRRLQSNKSALRLAYNLLYLACSGNFANSKKLTKGVIQSVFSLIGLINESTEKTVFKEPLKFLNKVYSTTAFLYGQIRILRESGFLSESDFIDHLDKITAMKYEFNASLLQGYRPSSTDTQFPACKTSQGRQQKGITLK